MVLNPGECEYICLCSNVVTIHTLKLKELNIKTIEVKILDAKIHR